MDTGFFQELCHPDCFPDFHSPLKAVPEVHFYKNGNIISGMFHNILCYLSHETAAVFKSPSIIVLPVVCVRGKELADQITMPRVHLNCIKTRIPGKVYG